MSYHEKHSRSIAKAISYRILTISIDSFFFFFITKEVSTTIGIVMMTNLYSTFLYYFHERAWNKIYFGKHALRPRKKKEAVSLPEKEVVKVPRKKRVVKPKRTV